MRRTAAVLALGLAGCQWIPGTDSHMIEEGKVLVAAQLHDPGSAEFRAERVGLLEAADGAPEPVVCGEVNGKNRFGAYAGFRRFVASPGDQSGLIEPSAQSDVQIQMLAESCNRARSRASGPTGSPPACQRLDEAIRESSEAAGFAAVWAAACE